MCNVVFNRNFCDLIMCWGAIMTGFCLTIMCVMFPPLWYVDELKAISYKSHIPKKFIQLSPHSNFSTVDKRPVKTPNSIFNRCSIIALLILYQRLVFKIFLGEIIFRSFVDVLNYPIMWNPQKWSIPHIVIACAFA